MKVVINSDYGGFSLSDEAIRVYAKKKGITLIEEKCGQFGHTNFYDGEISDDNLFWDRDIPREDETLVEVVEELGDAASGLYASLKVVEIPENVNWFIEEHDGREHVAETHRTWA